MSYPVLTEPNVSQFLRSSWYPRVIGSRPAYRSSRDRPQNWMPQPITHTRDPHPFPAATASLGRTKRDWILNSEAYADEIPRGRGRAAAKGRDSVARERFAARLRRDFRRDASTARADQLLAPFVESYQEKVKSGLGGAGWLAMETVGLLPSAAHFRPRPIDQDAIHTLVKLALDRR